VVRRGRSSPFLESRGCTGRDGTPPEFNLASNTGVLKFRFFDEGRPPSSQVMVRSHRRQAGTAWKIVGRARFRAPQAPAVRRRFLTGIVRAGAVVATGHRHGQPRVSARRPKGTGPQAHGPGRSFAGGQMGPLWPIGTSKTGQTDFFGLAGVLSRRRLPLGAPR